MSCLHPQQILRIAGVIAENLSISKDSGSQKDHQHHYFRHNRQNTQIILRVVSHNTTTHLKAQRINLWYHLQTSKRVKDEAKRSRRIKDKQSMRRQTRLLRLMDMVSRGCLLTSMARKLLLRQRKMLETTTWYQVSQTTRPLHDNSRNIMRERRKKQVRLKMPRKGSRRMKPLSYPRNNLATKMRVKIHDGIRLERF